MASRCPISACCASVACEPDILVLPAPIWLGEKSSVCTQVIERLYGNSHLLNEHGQHDYDNPEHR